MHKSDKARISKRFQERQRQRECPKVPSSLQNRFCFPYTYKMLIVSKFVLFFHHRFYLLHMLHQVYYTSSVRPDGSRAWQGGKHLSETAVWPWAFCWALLSRWQDHVKGAGPRPMPQLMAQDVQEISSDSESEN